MNLSNFKNALAFIAFIGVFAIAFTIATATHEAVPDRATFLVNTNERYVVPCPIAGRFIFHSLPDHPEHDDVFARFQDSVSWGELKKKDHPYHDYGLPENPEWDNFVMYGHEVSLFRHLFFPPPSRWDDEGNWRY